MVLWHNICVVYHFIFSSCMNISWSVILLQCSVVFLGKVQCGINFEYHDLLSINILQRRRSNMVLEAEWVFQNENMNKPTIESKSCSSLRLKHLYCLPLSTSFQVMVISCTRYCRVWIKQPYDRMYEVLYDQAGRLSVDKRVSTKQLKYNYSRSIMKVLENCDRIMINHSRKMTIKQKL